MPSQSGSVMRLSGRTLATQVHWYRHTVTGRELVLVLNNHIGSAAYFAVMRQRIAELEARGAVVYAEGVRPAADAEWATASPAEKSARAVLHILYHDQPAVMAAGLGWVFQAEALPLADGWVSPDLTDLDLIRAAGLENILALAEAATEANDRLGRHADWYMRAVAPLIYRRLARPHGRLSKLVTGLAPNLYAVLLEHRSKLAVAVIDPYRDAVLVYGAEHADSLAAELAAAGWAPSGLRKWLCVGQLPPLHRTVLDVLAMSWAVGRDLAARAQEQDA